MKIEQVKKLKPTDRFLYWIKERKAIYDKRQAGQPKPWTDDVVLQSYYFCNVERENDKVTKWFRENIREPLRDDPAVVFATIAFRWFNYIPTGILLWDMPEPSFLTSWNTEAVIRCLKERAKGQVFTGAFNISNSGSTKPKINRVCEDYIQPVWENRTGLYSVIRGKSTVEVFKTLQQYPGLGGSGFMAAQVICDLAYTHVLENAPDWWTWCSWGPGSKRGMNRVLGLPPENPISKERWKQYLDHQQILIKQKLSLKLHARDVQNCLCEFSKYETALHDDGHLKRRYCGNS